MTKAFLIGLTGSLVIMLGGLVAVHLWCGDDLPSLASVRGFVPAVRTEIYDSQGQLVATLSREDRAYVNLQEVSPHLLNAILSTEDRQFYRHWGINPLSLLRATLANVRRRSGPLQGGSTITQQLARNLFLTHEQTVTRKLREVVLALRLERSFSKDEILQLYINQIYFGEGAYGVETASRKFFGKPAKDLSIAEAAVLAGIPKNPARYSPHRNPRNAVARRNVVLGAMRKTGAIGAAEMEAARAESLIVLDGVSRTGVSGAAPHFVEEVRKALEAEFGSEAIYTGGLKVYTTLDLDLQEEAERALERHLQEVERFNRYWYLSDRSGRDDSVPVASTLPGDATRELQGAVVGLDPRSGAVRFMVGGRDFSHSKFNRATQARRQPGSAFKPFIYVTAIETGKVTTDVLLDAPIVRFLPNGDRWEPTNYSRTYSGLVALREALAKSINIPAVLLLEELGVDRVRQKARELGIASPLPRVLSLALGTGEVTLMELTAAYGPFANRGIYAEPYLVSRVEDRTGKVLLETRPRTREVLDEGVADLMSDLLMTVITSGTGESARREGLTGDAAGKTGTTDDYTDAWFIGYQSGLLAGVWVGFDLKLQIGHDMTGAFCALPIWTAIMKTAAKRYPPEPFPRSDRLVRVRVCRESGRLATPSCPADGVITETFLKGSEPELRCGFHQD